MVEYTVLLFGDAKAAAGGATRLVVHCTSPATTPRTLLAALARPAAGQVRLPDGAPFVPPAAWADTVRPAILAVNLEYVTETGLDLEVSPDSEIALIPPISGG